MNLTWLLNNDPVDPTLTEKASNWSVLTFNWQELEYMEGDMVQVTCFTQDIGTENNMTLASLTSVTEVLMVPEEENGQDGDNDDNDEDDIDVDENEDEDSMKK